MVLPNIIYGIESGCGTSNMLAPNDKTIALELLKDKLAKLQEQDPPLATVGTGELL